MRGRLELLCAVNTPLDAGEENELDEESYNEDMHFKPCL